MFRRSLTLPPIGTETFFLWGPRQTGKTTLLRHVYADARWVDLLRTDEFARYATRPERLREELVANPPPSRQVVVDEVQKVPNLLDEIHWLIENRGLHFALSGSSARRVRRAGVNLLGGRALRYSLSGLSASEIGPSFDLDFLLNYGYLPRIYGSERAARRLEAYVADYLRQEIAAEGVVRRLPVFFDFLTAAAFSDAETVNFSSLAREVGVSGPTIREYFRILEDTLLASWLPVYRRRSKRRVAQAPRFYFHDVGVVNRLVRRGRVTPGSRDYGKAFENWVFHELRTWRAYRSPDVPLSTWRLSSGAEVDFILGDMETAIEAKSSANVTSDHLRGLRTLAVDHPAVRRRVVVCREPRLRTTADGIEILPAADFVELLWAGAFATPKFCSVP